MNFLRLRQMMISPSYSRRSSITPAISRLILQKIVPYPTLTAVMIPTQIPDSLRNPPLNKMKMTATIVPAAQKNSSFSRKVRLFIRFFASHFRYSVWMISNTPIRITRRQNPFGGGKSAPAIRIAVQPKKNTTNSITRIHLHRFPFISTLLSPSSSHEK